MEGGCSCLSVRSSSHQPDENHPMSSCIPRADAIDAGNRGNRAAWQERRCGEMGVCVRCYIIWNTCAPGESRLCHSPKHSRLGRGHSPRPRSRICDDENGGADARAGDRAYLRCSVSHGRRVLRVFDVHKSRGLRRGVRLKFRISFTSWFVLFITGHGGIPGGVGLRWNPWTVA